MTGLMNPIAVREMRARMRGPRAFLFLSSYLLVLGLLIYIVYLKSGGGPSYSYPQNATTGSNLGPTVSYQIGQNIFLGIFLFLLLLVAIVTPAITAGGVSREVEGRTYDLLLVTPIHGQSLAFGKLFAALAFIFFLVVSALPLACIVFVFGGVTVLQLLIVTLLLLLTAFAYGAIGLYFSTIFRRTAVAVVFTYFMIIILTVGSWLLSSSIVSVINNDQKTAQVSLRINPNTDPAFDVPKRILVVNPLAALGSVLAANTPYRAASGDDLQLFPNSALFGGNINNYYRFQTFTRNTGATLPPPPPPLWAGYFLIYVMITLTFIIFTLLAMRPHVKPLKKARGAKISRPVSPPVLAAAILPIEVEPASVQPQPAALPEAETPPPAPKRIAQG